MYIVCIVYMYCVYIVLLLGGYAATCAAMSYPEIGGLVSNIVCVLYSVCVCI